MNKRKLKVIVLAARPKAHAMRMLEPLGDRRIIEHPLKLGLQFVGANHIYIVTEQEQSQIRSQLGEQFHYVVQDELRGTGHAVLQAADALADYDGDLLILYGDTPLLRSATIRGMLTRHRLKSADLTLLTATTDQQLPYGRIIRDNANHIIDVIEEEDASRTMREIRELNLGAYVTRAKTIFPTLQQLNKQNPDHLRLTDSIHPIIHSGRTVAGFSSHDPDEILGINTQEDLEQAKFIIQRRQFRPHRADENDEIRFGTGGWRAIIGEGFTMNNVRRLCQALAQQLIGAGKEQQGVLIGFDRRFLGDRAAKVATEVFAGNNIPVTLLPEDVPTPLVTYATALKQFAYGLIFTASHNPPEWNGLKVFHQDGSLLLSDETDRIEQVANGLISAEVPRLELDIALKSGIVQHGDFTNDYVDAIEQQINMQAIREANLRVLIDPMYGTGQATLDTILTEARCRVSTIHGRHDPLFGGRSPAPDLQALGSLIHSVKEGKYDLGMAMDGDADRIAIVDELGEFIHINDLLLLLYYYLRDVKGVRGGVVRNLATTHLLDRLAAHYGEKSIETPVGFKHIVQGMQQHNALLGGESSGGLTIRGHILGKDGIFASALIVEMLAVTGKKISELRQLVYAITDRLYSIEANFPATSEMKIIVPNRLQTKPIDNICGHAVLNVSHADGTKFLFENDNWLLLRFSGTEPVLRIFSEADTLEKAQTLVDWAANLLRA